MKFLDIDNWNRKAHFYFFNEFVDPYFGVTVEVDVTDIYHFSKKEGISFFVLYLHACMKAINTVENFKYRIVDGKIVVHETIHTSATIAREDHTFGFTFIEYVDDFSRFYENFKQEKTRVQNSTGIFGPINTDDCVYCSALPWFTFTGHKEPVMGIKESVPKLSFGKAIWKNNRLKMPVAVMANHALMDGYHIGLFYEAYQKILNEYV